MKINHIITRIYTYNNINAHSHKQTTLLTGSFTKPHSNSHTNFIFSHVISIELINIKPKSIYNLRSNQSLLLDPPKGKMLVTLGDRSFSAAAPYLWKVCQLNYVIFNHQLFLNASWKLIYFMQVLQRNLLTFTLLVLLIKFIIIIINILYYYYYYYC